MREILIIVSDGNITASTDFAGYQGEHNATIFKFELPEELQNQKYKYKVNITLPDDITATASLKDMSLVLTSTLTASEGIIALQLVVSEGNTLIYKSGITNLRIKPSLAPTAIIGGTGGNDGVGISAAIVNEEGNLIITLTDDSEINAGYVKGADGKDGLPGEKGDKGDSYDSKRFELIESITIDSNDILAIERTQEPNGTAYAFEEVFINFEIDVGATSAGITCRVNNIASVGISNLISTEKKYCTLQFQANRGLLFTSYQVPVTDKTWANNVRTRNVEVLSVEAINSLRFSCNTPIPTGSRITIYAVRKRSNEDKF